MTLKPKPYHSHSKNLLWHIGVLIAVGFWGISFVSTKVLLTHGMGPVEVYVSRFTIAYLMLLLINHKQLRCYNLRDEGIFLLCGMSSGSLYFIAENTALEYTLVTNVSLITSISPLLTAFLLAMLYKNQKLGWGMILGSLIAFIGVGCVIFNSNFAMEVNPLGDLLSFAAALLWAVYALLVRSLDANYDTYFITRKIFFYGVLTAIPFWLIRGDLHNPFASMTDTAVIVNVIFLAFGASLLAFMLWNLGLKKLGTITTNNYMYLQPVVTMIASAILIGERITMIGVTGCVLIIGGLWLGDYLSSARTAKHAKI